MKTKITNNDTFKPIELIITIESIEGLRELAIRLNLSHYKANEFGLLEDDIIIEDSTMGDLFNLVYDRYKSLIK